MTREEFTRKKFQYEIAHSGYGSSPLKGTQRDDVKYYKREGTPGNYTYYYSKAAYDTAMETKNRNEYEASKRRTNTYAYEHDLHEAEQRNAYEKNKKEEQEKKSKQSNTLYSDAQLNPNYGNELAEAIKQNLAESDRLAEEGKKKKAWAEAIVGDIKSLKYLDDSAVNEVYDQMHSLRVQGEYDINTGLYKKSYDLGIEDELKLINPVFNYKDNVDYVNNCVSCTLAMVLREKGYDVSAGKDSDGIKTNKSNLPLSDEYSNIYSNINTVHEWTKNYNRLINDLSKEPAGSYGDLIVEWESGGLHSLFYKIDSYGLLHVYDAQIGKELEYSEYKQRVKKGKYNRLDDADINYTYIKRKSMILYN